MKLTQILVDTLIDNEDIVNSKYENRRFYEYHWHILD